MSNPRDQLLNDVANLMRKQGEAYTLLEASTSLLSAALISGDLVAVEKHTREGERELTRMRSGLLEIMSTLTRFAEQRPAEGTKLDIGIKREFETSAKALIEKAREFKRLAERTANLALGGSSFAAACIQGCGIPPSTYNKPVLRRTEASA